MATQQKVTVQHCSGKLRYRTREDAHSAGVKVKIAKRDRTPISAYQCNACEGWHWGRDRRK